MVSLSWGDGFRAEDVERRVIKGHAPYAGDRHVRRILLVVPLVMCRIRVHSRR